MQRYNEWAPTGFDSKGLLADYHGIGEWYVFPCAQNRDSGCLEQSNFAVALESLGGESATVEVHRFGHWACGWFEVIVIDPADTIALAAAESAIEALENYPVLDDDDLCNREHEEALEYWENYGRSEFVRDLAKQASYLDAEQSEDSDNELLEYIVEDMDDSLADALAFGTEDMYFDCRYTGAVDIEHTSEGARFDYDAEAVFDSIAETVALVVSVGRRVHDYAVGQLALPS